MKKILLFVTISFMAFIFIACGNPYIGKIVKKDMTRQIQIPSGKKHHYVLNHIVVDYTYTIFPEQQMIIVKGKIDDRHQDARSHFVRDEGGWKLNESYLDIYFLNADRRVIDFCRKSFPLGHSTLPYPFEAKCRYTSEYRNTALSYKYRFVKYTSKGKAEKTYQHRLDIE